MTSLVLAFALIGQADNINRDPLPDPVLEVNRWRGADADSPAQARYNREYAARQEIERRKKYPWMNAGPTERDAMECRAWIGWLGMRWGF